MISSGIILPNILEIIIIQERGIPFLTNQDSMDRQRDLFHTAQVLNLQRMKRYIISHLWDDLPSIPIT